MFLYSLGKGFDYDRVGDEIVVYGPDGNLYVLNDSASYIFDKVIEGLSVGETVDAVTAQFDVSGERVLRDVEVLTNQLEEYAILSRDTEISR